MGALDIIKKTVTGSGSKGRKLKSQAAEYFGKSTDDLTKSEFDSFLKYQAKSDVAKAPTDATRSAVRSLSYPVLGGGAAVGGAYAYGEHQETQREEESTERHRAYQNRIEHIEALYRRGDITKAEMQRRKEEAQQAYYASQGDDGTPMSATELIAQMGTLQLLASAGVVSVLLYFVARPIVNDIDLQSTLG